MESERVGAAPVDQLEPMSRAVALLALMAVPATGVPEAMVEGRDSPEALSAVTR